MPLPAIRVENLGKRYRLGATHSHTLGEFVSAAAGRLLGRRIGHIATPKLPDNASKQVDEDGNFWALKDVSFDVQPGEVVGIIGRNGAGKSTLLKILSNIVSPSTGRVTIHGRVASLVEVGTGFHPELTGSENIYLNGAILGMTKAEIRRKFDEIVAFSEIDHFINTPVKRYSSGMYVRLAFAVAAHLDPEILIVDEVLAVGDIAFQRKCLGKLGDVAHQGRTVLFVSHNMPVIRAMCTTAACLENGSLTHTGTCDTVLDTYLLATSTQTSCAADIDCTQIACADPAFALRRITILQQGAPTTHVSASLPLDICLSYTVLHTTIGLHVYIQLYDTDDTLLFESLHNGSYADVPTVPRGTYSSRVRIPADLLSPRRYELRILASIHNVRSLLPSPIRVRLDVSPGGNANRAYPGYLTAGKLSPLLEWETTLAIPDSPAPYL